jgi:transposase
MCSPWRAVQSLPAATRESVEQWLRVHDCLSSELEKAEGYLRAVDRRFPELARLRTLPGIGEILAPVIWSEIGRLERFRYQEARWGRRRTGVGRSWGAGKSRPAG